MYLKEQKNGSVVTIQNLQCNLPEVGYVKNYITDKYEKVGVYSRSKKNADCYWEVDPRWKLYKQWMAEEEERKKRDALFVHSELHGFINECWLYRLGGFWFNNNGEPTYITGRHWYYLSCYNLDVGLPKYKTIDKEYFYFLEYAFTDPHSLGIVELTKRRIGKSYRAGCVALEAASRTAQFNVGIQSKTDEDAEKFFKKNIIDPYRKLPLFFKPITNLPNSGKMSVGKLAFESGKALFDGEDLSSIIDYSSSRAMAYDGQKLGIHIGDEAGKLTTDNVNDRLDVVRYCLMDDEGNVIGKTIHTTTVEKETRRNSNIKDQDTCDRNFLKLWKDSDQTDLKDGRTTSGLYRFFIPADRTRYTDQYGNPDVKKAYDEIQAERKRVSSNQRRLANLKRKEPLDEKEAFQADSESTIYNPELLNERENTLKWTTPQYETGFFRWVEIYKEVEFVKSVNGRFKVLYHPPEEYRNKFTKYGDSYSPNNTDLFYAGIDTFDHRYTTQQSAKQGLSNGAIVIRKKPHPVITSPYENAPVCIYCFRPASPELFYEDCIMALFYYGCKSLIENNKPGIIHYMEDHGFFDYLAWLQGKNTPGISAGVATNNLIAELTDQFISDDINNVFFPELVSDWLSFDVANTQEFDIAMAFGYSEIYRKTVLNKLTKKKETVNVEDYISFWK